MVKVSVNIEQSLIFFDEKPRESFTHATSVCLVAGEELGIGLLIDYMMREGKQATLLSRKCTTGRNKGSRLDAWIQLKEQGRDILYQVEVKNWSAHAIGGKSLPLDAKTEVISAHKIERWGREWRSGSFLKEGVRKVLTPMKPPTLSYDSIEPCVCYWDALHPNGKDEPFFDVKPHNHTFPLVHIFSMSAYLRILRKEGKLTITLDMPDTIQRLDWLNKILKIYR